MAIAVMVVIILINLLLLLTVMRVGTNEDFQHEVAADDSAAVLAWRARLAAGASQKDERVAEASDA